MKVEIKIQRGVQYTGKKAKNSGRIAAFVEYCPDCRGKVIISLPDARRFATMYGKEQSRVS